MSAGSRMRTWWRAIVHADAVDAQLSEELRFHVESRTEELMRSGMARAKAEQRARAELGSLAAARENARQAWGTRQIDELGGDLRYALRMLAKSPGFAAIAIGSLALGIGANTAIFSLAKHMLLDRLNVPRPAELRLFSWHSLRQSAVHSSWGDWDHTPKGVVSTSFSYPVYQLLRRQNHEVADLFAFKNLGRLNVTVNGQAEVVQGDLVSGNFYQQMEVEPQLGRAIGPGDDRAGAPPVAVISDSYWASRFDRSPTAIGKTLLVNLVEVTIVGVNPAGFTGAKGTQSSPELFLPFSVQPQVFPYHNAESLLTSDRVWWMQVMARVKPGIDATRAQAALDVSLQAAVRATMTVKKDESVPQLDLIDGSRGMDEIARQMSEPLWLLLALTGLVVLLACANMANLLLARSAARQREMSVRLALGARRGRIVRQVMTESLLLAVLGGLAGLLVGWFGRQGMLALFSSPTEPLVVHGGLDWGVFAFDAAVSLVTGVLFGVAPAWNATRTQVSTTVKDNAETATRRRRGLAGKAIVGFQWRFRRCWWSRRGCFCGRW
jgi:predicted permease